MTSKSRRFSFFAFASLASDDPDPPSHDTQIFPKLKRGIGSAARRLSMPISPPMSSSSLRSGTTSTTASSLLNRTARDTPPHTLTEFPSYEEWVAQQRQKASSHPRKQRLSLPIGMMTGPSLGTEEGFTDALPPPSPPKVPRSAVDNAYPSTNHSSDVPLGALGRVHVPREGEWLSQITRPRHLSEHTYDRATGISVASSASEVEDEDELCTRTSVVNAHEAIQYHVQDPTTAVAFPALSTADDSFSLSNNTFVTQTTLTSSQNGTRRKRRNTADDANPSTSSRSNEGTNRRRGMSEQDFLTVTTEAVAVAFVQAQQAIAASGGQSRPGQGSGKVSSAPATHRWSSRDEHQGQRTGRFPFLGSTQARSQEKKPRPRPRSALPSVSTWAQLHHQTLQSHHTVSIPAQIVLKGLGDNEDRSHDGQGQAPRPYFNLRGSRFELPRLLALDSEILDETMYWQFVRNSRVVDVVGQVPNLVALAKKFVNVETVRLHPDPGFIWSLPVRARKLIIFTSTLRRHWSQFDSAYGNVNSYFEDRSAGYLARVGPIPNGFERLVLNVRYDDRDLDFPDAELEQFATPPSLREVVLIFTQDLSHAPPTFSFRRQNTTLLDTAIITVSNTYTRINYTLVGVENLWPAWMGRAKAPSEMSRYQIEKSIVDVVQRMRPGNVHEHPIQHMSFYTHAEYRAKVGEEQYALETVVVHDV
ncbi:uncharacterized protein EHS24_001688 [Apiotrichum porosum]|uniref:Uncharacterized protein n=1 Tax=Apiotrichum porosum TaxID=105984 RepID=A0A427XIU1_9TREE|nr:uncharacterized protein EHS24_001688 [Apiotrichum porosum]RSH78780.1 hypothetical protein EHS24_001688 [Apiotrichum porosum]